MRDARRDDDQGGRGSKRRQRGVWNMHSDLDMLTS